MSGKVLENYCCGLIIQELNENDELVDQFTKDFKDDEIPFYDYQMKNGVFKKLLDEMQNDQVINDIIEFNEYIKRTYYADRSFEENLFVCIEQITFLRKHKIFSEDGKHCCVISPSGCPNVYYIDIDGFKSIIYTSDYNIRMITLFNSILNKNLFN